MIAALGGLPIADEVIIDFRPLLTIALRKRRRAKLHRPGVRDGRTVAGRRIRPLAAS